MLYLSSHVKEEFQPKFDTFSGALSNLKRKHILEMLREAKCGSEIKEHLHCPCIAGHCGMSHDSCWHSHGKSLRIQWIGGSCATCR